VGIEVFEHGLDGALDEVLRVEFVDVVAHQALVDLAEELETLDVRTTPRTSVAGLLTGLGRGIIDTDEHQKGSEGYVQCDPGHAYVLRFLGRKPDAAGENGGSSIHPLTISGMEADQQYACHGRYARRSPKFRGFTGP